MKELPCISENVNPKKLIFQEVTCQAQKKK